MKRIRFEINMSLDMKSTETIGQVEDRLIEALSSIGDHVVIGFRTKIGENEENQVVLIPCGAMGSIDADALEKMFED